MQPVVLLGSSASWQNQLEKALLSYIFNDLRTRVDDVVSPESLENILTEWLATEGFRFRRCRVDSIVFFIRPYKGYPALRIYYENDVNLKLHPFLIIGFRPYEDVDS